MSTWAVPSYSEGWTVPGYTEEREIGRGASGKVVRAVHDASGHPVAVKYLSPALTEDPAFMWAFRIQVQRLRELSVPQVVQVYDFVEQPSQGAAIVTELVNGVSLHELIERRGPAVPEVALAVLKDSLLGLAAAHALGVVHRDYKPENVLIDSAGNSRLVDFGVAVQWGKRMPTAGTPLYLAPEQWRGAPASPASDIYAATAVCFECLAGQPPFSGKAQQLLQQHVTAAVPLQMIDPPLQGLIARGMAKSSVDRPQSAIAFVSELEALASFAYGPDWEERGRSRLAANAAALGSVLLRDGHPVVSGRSYASTWEGGSKKRKILTTVAVAGAAVVILGGGAAAVVLRGNTSQANLSGSSSSTSQAVTANDPSYTAVANVTPPVKVSTCATPSKFTFTATISATAAGSMKYQWVYSSGKPGPVQTLRFSGPGKKMVTGKKVTTEKAGSGSGEIKLLSPAMRPLDRASYQLICSNLAGRGQVTAPAFVPSSASSAAPTAKASPSPSPETGKTPPPTTTTAPPTTPPPTTPPPATPPPATPPPATPPPTTPPPATPPPATSTAATATGTTGTV